MTWQRVSPADFAAQLDLIFSRVRHAGLDSPSSTGFLIDGSVLVQIRGPQQTTLWASHLNLPTPQRIGSVYQGENPWQEFRADGFVDGIRVSTWCSVPAEGGAS